MMLYLLPIFVGVGFSIASLAYRKMKVRAHLARVAAARAAAWNTFLDQ